MTISWPFWPRHHRRSEVHHADPELRNFHAPGAEAVRRGGEGARNINECLPKLKDVFCDKRGMAPKNERSRDVAFLLPQDTNEIGVGRRALEAEETKIGAFDGQHFVDLVLKFLRKFASASRKQIYKLLWDKLSKALRDVRKKSKNKNILNKLRVSGKETPWVSVAAGLG